MTFTKTKQLRKIKRNISFSTRGSVAKRFIKWDKLGGRLQPFIPWEMCLKGLTTTLRLLSTAAHCEPSPQHLSLSLSLTQPPLPTPLQPLLLMNFTLLYILYSCLIAMHSFSQTCSVITLILVQSFIQVFGSGRTFVRKAENNNCICTLLL